MSWIEMPPKGNLKDALDALNENLATLAANMAANTQAINNRQKIKSVQRGTVTMTPNSTNGSVMSASATISTVNPSKCKLKILGGWGTGIGGSLSSACGNTSQSLVTTYAPGVILQDPIGIVNANSVTINLYHGLIVFANGQNNAVVYTDYYSNPNYYSYINWAGARFIIGWELTEYT